MKVFIPIPSKHSSKYYSWQSRWKDYRPGSHVTSECQKNSFWLYRNISKQNSTHPEAETHTNANTHIIPCMHKHTNTHTQTPKNTASFWSHALTSGSQSKGCCSPVYNSTTDPQCSSCKFCSFSSGLRGVLCCFMKRRRRHGEAREQRSEATVCARPLNHCVCMKAGIVCACVCVRARVCDPLQYMRT